MGGTTGYIVKNKIYSQHIHRNKVFNYLWTNKKKYQKYVAIINNDLWMDCVAAELNLLLL